MNETRFRELMRQAIGVETVQPWLAGEIRTRLVISTELRKARRLVPLAAVVAGLTLVVLAFVLPRLIAH